MAVRNPIQKDDILQGFAALGLRKGDALLFHSSLKSFGYVHGGAETVIDGAIEAVGATGTVVVPTFVQKVNGESATYRTRREAWNIRTSPSDVGHVTEVFRRRPDAVRSDHCCDSLAAIGAEAEAAMGGHKRAGSSPQSVGPEGVRPWLSVGLAGRSQRPLRPHGRRLQRLLHLPLQPGSMG